jgi:hypothetical protein
LVGFYSKLMNFLLDFFALLKMSSSKWNKKAFVHSTLHTILGSTGNIGTFLAKNLTAFTDNIRLVSRNPFTGVVLLLLIISPSFGR